MRILLFDSLDPILKSLFLAFKKLGHQVDFLSLEGNSESYSRQLDLQISQFKPDFFLTNNFYLFRSQSGERELEKVFQKNGLPVICWFYEAPHHSGHWTESLKWDESPPPSDFLFLVSDSAHVHFFRDRGLKAEFLPLGVDENQYAAESTPQQLKRFEAPLCYVGSALKVPDHILRAKTLLSESFAELTHQELWGRLSEQVQDRTHFDKALQHWFKETRSLTEDFFKQKIFNKEDYLSRRSNYLEMFLNRVPSQMKKYVQAYLGRFDYLYGYYLLTESLKSLLDFKIQIYGDDWWSRVLKFENSGRLTEEELIACYRSSKIIFCLTKYQFRNLMHDRPMAVLASGGFPLTDWREDLPAMFEADEIESYHSLEEAREKIKFYLAHEAARQEVVRKGHKRVLDEHTYFHRSQKIAQFFKNNF